MKTNLLLNSIFLKNRLAELSLKQWWLAEQVGVDRKTVVRWIQGKVKSIQPENAEALCKILNCSLDELCLNNEAEQLATPQDQKTAAELLVQSSLIEKLGPIGEWNVIESLLKATILQNLPLDVLGQLYNQLTVASWRQSKIEQADVYNKKAMEIADKLNDKTLKAQALLSQANIFSWRGKTKKSIETYKSCLELSKFIEPKTIAATYSNLGGVYYESGYIDLGEKAVKKSIELYQFHGKPMNLSIAYVHMATISILKKDFDQAQVYADKSIEFAKQDEFRRGICAGNILTAEILANKNNFKEAKTKLAEALNGYKALNIEEGLNYEIAGRVSRIIGENEQSKSYIEKGISISDEFPVYQAALYVEYAKTLFTLKNDPGPAINKAIELYIQSECELKTEELKSIKF